MGDEIVDLATKFLSSTAYANGVSPSAIRPIADKVVNSLREYGLDEQELREIFTEQNQG